LWDNQITDISPLSSLTDLEVLYLDNNKITDISPLAELEKLGDWEGYMLERNGYLVHLALSYNQISDISPLVKNSGIGEGDVIDLTGNPLLDSAYNIHIPALEERGAIVLFDPLPMEATNPFNGHEYMLVHKGMTWREAKAYAEELGGHLATITSFEEQDWICQTFPGVRCWLGGTDEEVEGEWKWVTGERWDYTNWARSEPNNVDTMGGEENALEIKTESGFWNDHPTDYWLLTPSLLVEFDSPNDQK